MSRSKRGPGAPDRWRSRPLASAVIRGLVLVVPGGIGVATGVTVSRLIPLPDGAAIGWWLMLFAVSGVTTEIVARAARRLLPLTVLLKLTLIFPDRAPSRLRMARRAGSTRNLKERVRYAKEHGPDDDPSRAAETILELVAALSAHDRRTRGHSERVRALTDVLARSLSLPEADADRLRWSALLHDIGKLEVPERILNKPGKPHPREWEAIRRHPAEGARLAAPLLPWLGEWGRAIEQHHERFDGRGYPRGLTGARISRAARILAVTDSFETMTAARAYRKPMSVSAAREELTRVAGAQFDPAIVRAFLAVSLGRQWRIVGPMSWLAQVPFVGPGARGVAQVAGAGLAKIAVGIAAVGVSGGIVGSRSPAIAAGTAGVPASEMVVSGQAAVEPSGGGGPGRDREDETPGGDVPTEDGEDGGGPNGSEGSTGPSTEGTDPSDPIDGGDGGAGGGGGGTVAGDGTETGGDGSGTGGGGTVIGDVVDDTVDTLDGTVDGVTDAVGDTVDDVADGLGGLGGLGG